MVCSAVFVRLALMLSCSVEKYVLRVYSSLRYCRLQKGGI